MLEWSTGRVDTLRNSWTVRSVALVGLLALIGIPDQTALAFLPQAGSELGSVDLIRLLELPFLFGCVYFAFRTAYQLKGGIFGAGMQLLAWGFLVMAVGHLHLQIAEYTGFNLFENVVGPTAGTVLWIVALLLTWGLSGAGFYKIYRASKGR